MAEAGPSSGPPSVAVRLKFFAGSSKQLSRDELRELLHVAEICKAYLKERAVELLQNNAGQPCLFQYSCDTTPVSSRKYLTRQHGSIKVQRTCKSSSDYFVQQMFLYIPSHDNGYHCTILFREPLPLAYGKTMKALFSAACTCPGLSLNGVGPDVISIHHQCHDRAVTFDFVGSLSGWWSKQVGVSEAAAGPAAADSDDEKLFEWHSWTACAAHDGHNSCKWGHQGLFNDSFLLESCYVGVMAMRACFHHAASHLADWLVQVLSPKRQDELPAVSDLFLLWCALGIDQDIAKLLSEMQLFWLGGTLVVLHSVLDDSNWLEAISTCLLSVWRPPAFTTSRWCTVGASCRGLLSGLVTGYPAFLQWLHTAGKLGDYEWHGCKRLDAKVWHFAAVVGLSSYVSDSFLAKVLKDSRVAQTQQSLQEVLWNEFLFLDVLPQQFWDMLSGPVQMTSQAVRSGVIAGALISWSFLEWRVLLVASSLPWRLCSGSVEANVDELLQQAEPPDTGIAFKIWALGQAGYNRTRLARAVQLLGQCSWTSAFTEKQHGSTSVVKKRHPDYGDNHLTAKAFIHTFAQMLPSSSACDQRRQQVLQKLCRTLDKNPNRITGRQVYLAHVMQKAREKEASDPKQPRYNRAKIMKLHGQQWTSLPEESKASWDRQAAFERSATWQSRQKECDNLKQQLGLLSEAGSGSDSKAPGSSMLISQCRLSTSEQCRLQSMIDDSKLTEKSVEKLRAKSLQCPPPVPDQDLDSCLGHSQLRRDRPTEMPATARRICQMRDHFAQSVFLVEHPQGSRFYRFLFAMLNPVRLFLLDLGDLECPVPAVTSGPPCFNQQWQASVPWQWSFLPGRFSSAEVFDVSPNVQIGVFLHSWFSSEGSLCSRDVLQPLDLILDAAASEKKVAKERSEPSRKSVVAEPDAELTAQYPWLRTFVGTAAASKRKRASCTDDADFSSEDIQYDDLFEQLEEQRCVINAAFETLADQFRTSLIGGDWQLRRTGRVVYGVRIDVKAGSSMAEFCAKFSLAKSASFEQSVYGDEPGQALGKLFIHRMSFLMQLWEDLGRPDHGIPADRLTDYVPAPDLETVLSTTTGRVQQRYRKILALAPKAPRLLAMSSQSRERTPPRAASKLAAAWQAETEGVKLPRPKRAQNVDSQVRKAITDNLRSMTPTELDGILVEGLTCRQRLKRDKAQASAAAGSIQFGKHYYTRLRAMYADKQSVQQKLQPDPALEVQPALVRAATAAMGHPPCRSHMVQFLERALSLNQAEICGIYRWTLTLHPAGSADQLEACKCVVACAARLKLQASAGKETALMLDKFDEILLQAFLSYAKAGLGPVDWLSNHDEMWPLVLPKAATQKVLDLGPDGSWLDVAEELAEITTSSALGKQLFGFAARQVVGLRLDKLVAEQVDKALTRNPITAEVVAEVRNTAMIQVESLAEADVLSGRRTVNISYRGCAITAKTTCAAEHFDFALQAALRGAAAVAGNIPSLPAEDQLCTGITRVAKGTKVEAKLFKHAKESRSMALALIKAEDCKNGESVQARLPFREMRLGQSEVLEASRARLLSLDKHVWIDLAFLANLAGEGGRKRLQDIYMDTCVPSQTKLMSLQRAIQCSTKLMESDLYRYVSQGSQGIIVAAHSMLDRIVQGMPVSIDQNASDFLKQVSNSYSCFIVHVAGHETKYDDEGLLVVPDNAEVTVGKAALLLKWKAVESEAVENLDLKQMEAFVTWGHFLADDQRQQAHSKIEQILKAAKGKRQGVTKKSAAPKQGAAKKAPHSAQADAKEAAMSLFA
ncbi:unnamed protein product [Symbiodinium sp. CCMP2592]|nr:unnamed protein product [Symbiodinium sp. CCMP2592]